MNRYPTIEGFPSHLIDPTLKSRDWILKYIKASWHNNDTIRAIFYHNSWKYREIKDYAFGKQSVDQYKKTLTKKEDAKATWMNVDWKILPIITKFRRIALNKIKKINYDIDAIAVDTIATGDKETYIAEQKAKMAFRAELSKTNPQLSEALNSEGDAQNLDELKIKELYTYKHNATIEMEKGIELIMVQNEWDKARDEIIEDLFDYGVSGYKDWIDSAGNVRLRRIDPARMMVSRCLKSDFSDKQYAGEVVRMTISDLKQAAGDQFDEAEYEKIAFLVRNQFGNPSQIPEATVYTTGYDHFHIEVLDMEFYSVNEMVYEKRRDKRGNNIYGRTKYKKREDTNTTQYKRKNYKVVYQGCWVIGTDFMFNYGLASNMKRLKSNMSDVEMSYNFYAPELFDMEAIGITEQLIPLANSIQIAWYKLQNAINIARPKGVEIDIDALEDIPIGSGGANLKAHEIIDLFNETGTLVYRRRDQAGDDANYRPIREIENGVGKDALFWYEKIQRDIQMIRDITGLNELVDGSTPDARTLTTVANMAYESSNNALGDVIQGDEALTLKLGNSVYIRLQDAVKFGNIKGYIKSLGTSSVNFIKVTSSIMPHEYGISLRLAMTDDERGQFKMELKEMVTAGMIDADSAVIVGGIRNKDQAEQVLAHMVKQKREREQKIAEENIKQTGLVQQQSAQVAEQAKQQTEQLVIRGKIELEKVTGQNKLAEIDRKYQWELKLGAQSNEGKSQQTALQGLNKITEKEMDTVKNTEKAPSQ